VKLVVSYGKGGFAMQRLPLVFVVLAMILAACQTNPAEAEPEYAYSFQKSEPEPEPELEPTPTPPAPPVQPPPPPPTTEYEEVALYVIGNPTPDAFEGQDFFIYLDLVAINASDIDWVMAYDLAVGSFLGEVLRTGIVSNHVEWDATHLPVGTRIYEHSQHWGVLVAVDGNTRIPYLLMREG